MADTNRAGLGDEIPIRQDGRSAMVGFRDFAAAINASAVPAEPDLDGVAMLAASNVFTVDQFFGSSTSGVRVVVTPGSIAVQTVNRATDAAPEAMTVKGGNALAGAATNKTGAALAIAGGAGATNGSGVGGAVNITGGAAPSGTGGAVAITSGAGDTAGALSIAPGASADSSGVNVTIDGGDGSGVGDVVLCGTRGQLRFGSTILITDIPGNPGLNQGSNATHCVPAYSAAGSLLGYIPICVIND